METGITKEKTQLNIEYMQKTGRTAHLSLIGRLSGDGEWKVC